jgi:hypothetical protein
MLPGQRNYTWLIIRTTSFEVDGVQGVPSISQSILRTSLSPNQPPYRPNSFPDLLISCQIIEYIQQHREPRKMVASHTDPVTAKNKFDDLSGIDITKHENPYDALIEACENDTVRLTHSLANSLHILWSSLL